MVAIWLAVMLLLGSLLPTGWSAQRAEAASEVNVLRNGSYEELNSSGSPLHWAVYRFSGTPEVAVDSTVVLDGEQALRIDASETSRVTMYQNVLIPMEERGLYTFRQWIKTEDVAGIGAYIRMFLVNQTGGRAGNLIELEKLTGTNDWTLVEASIIVPNNEEIVGVKIENFFDTGTGTAWYDGGTLTKVDTGSEGNMVVNGGFEALGPDGSILNWGTWIASGSPTVTADTYEAYSGSHSLRIESAENGRAAVVQGIPLGAEHLGQSFKLGMQVKTDHLTGGAVARLQFNDANGKRVNDLIYLDTLRETQDWTWVEKVVQIPDNSAIATVKIENFFETGTGTAWFDDMTMIPWYPLEGITLSEELVTMTAGDTVTLDVYFSPEEASDRRITWDSSAPSVAEVSDGVITAQTDGIAVITATAQDGGYEASTVVIVGESSGITASDQAVETDEDQFVRGTVEAESAYGRALTYWLAIDSREVLVHVETDGSWSYYPDAGFSGEDSFTVAVEDGAGSFAVAKVNVTVQPINHAPTATEGIQPTDKNTPVSGQIEAQDSDGDLLQFVASALPEHGQIELTSDGEWTYTPVADYTGEDAFTVRVEDGRGGTDTAKVRLYTAPTADEIVSAVKLAHPNQQHPRLLATADDFSRIRSLVQTDENAMRWFIEVKQSADEFLTQPPKEYSKPDGLRLDSSSARRVATLAFVYQITLDEQYAERAWDEMAFVASDAYPDWSPQHYLDTASMTQGIALGYDWLYNYLTEEQRAIVRESIKTKGLQPAVPMYLNKTYWWVYNRDNWNFVCNAGMALGALAIADEEEELAGLILREAFKSIQYGLTQYAPDGSAIEGPAYWEYGTMFLVYFLDALDTAVGHDYGFSTREGLADTPLYPIHVAGPQGTFNYSDNASNLIPGRLHLWFADKYDAPEYTWYHQYVTENVGTNGMYDLIWYRPETYGAYEPSTLDRYFELPEAVTMRSHWSDSHALFAGFKGGVNGAPHGDLDTGSFVFDALGVRWAEDLGKEDYNLPGYWDMGEDGKRWVYYRKRAEGHNTLVINPSEEPAQAEEAVSAITRTEFENSEGAYAITDMTPAYAEHMASVQRGAALLDQRRQFLVQDEVEAKVPSELNWFMHTRADIAVQEDGASALLTYGDKRLWVQILTPAEASFTVTEAVPLATSPNPSGQTPNLGVKKLTIHMEEVLRSTISVWMVPLMPGDPLPMQTPQVTPLSAWSVGQSELAKLDSLTVAGEPVTGFDPDRRVYEIELPAGEQSLPTVAASANEDLAVSIEQVQDIPGTARIVVSDPSGAIKTNTYYVSFTYPPLYGIPDDRLRHDVISVTASEHDGNVPENTIDGNLGTRWSAYGEQWIQFELDGVQDVGAISAAWYSGNVRSSFFNIELSEDGEQWTRVYDGFSSGETLEHEQYRFTSKSARYIRINGFGNNQSLWNSIAEIGIFGPRLVLEGASIFHDEEVLRRKGSVQLHIEARLNSEDNIDPSELQVTYYTSDSKIASINESGVMYSQKTGTAEVWAEVTYEGNTVITAPLQVVIHKKNGHDPLLDS